MHLSPRARTLLRDATRMLRTQRDVEKKRSKVVDEIVAWCEAHDIELGPRLTHGRLHLDRDLLTRIEETLTALGEPSMEADLSGLTSAEQARLGNREQKSVRESPREQRVLASLSTGVSRPGLVSRPRDVLDLDWRDISLDAFDTLIQVENLDGFYAFDPAIPALAGWHRPLVLYRGDRHYGGGFARVANAWASHGRTHLYLGDFDAAGLHNALGSAATHLLLPSLAFLASQASGEQLPAEQYPLQASLRDHADRLPAEHPLAGHFRLLLGEQRGLLQQWFGPVEALEPVPLV
ncbi:DUF7281 domain-containing protein [Halomonas sp. RA08-2]|uniref:DUF7281 domain-containing protein n=1 Tax=Halomonas sp. RA08-2 TaxID=3440842 RepID=UPI003EEF4B24